MKAARMLGNYVLHKAEEKEISIQELEKIVQLTEVQVAAFLDGRLFLTFSQLKALANALNLTTSELLKGDEQTYNATVVHCMNDFSDDNHREMILDLIEDYMDIRDAVR